MEEPMDTSFAKYKSNPCAVTQVSGDTANCLGWGLAFMEAPNLYPFPSFLYVLATICQRIHRIHSVNRHSKDTIASKQLTSRL
eukprot:998056-Ditylum_brightwellii.AAC.1